MKRTVISRSKKRKMGNRKANDYTEMVVYNESGYSLTKHEIRKNSTSIKN